jgi:hypothetical protein
MQKSLLIRGQRGKIKYRVKVSDYLHNTLKNVTLTFYEQGMFVRGAFFYPDGWVSTPQKIQHSIRAALYKLAEYVQQQGGAIERAAQAAKQGAPNGQ